MSKGREFTLGTVVSAISGRLVTDNPAEMMMFFLFATDSDPDRFLSEFACCSDELKQWLIAQYPWLSDIIVPDDLAPDTWQAWLASQEDRYGKTLVIQPRA